MIPETLPRLAGDCSALAGAPCAEEDADRFQEPPLEETGLSVFELKKGATG